MRFVWMCADVKLCESERCRRSQKTNPARLRRVKHQRQRRARRGSAELGRVLIEELRDRSAPCSRGLHGKRARSSCACPSGIPSSAPQLQLVGGDDHRPALVQRPEPRHLVLRSVLVVELRHRGVLCSRACTSTCHRTVLARIPSLDRENDLDDAPDGEAREGEEGLALQRGHGPRAGQVSAKVQGVG